ncbi:hypothetical protein BGZ76_005658 [Entomortierella beljakovae]|nr:hypothetical protein BGZ76_005658 [Entomortierella beljakovae]
MSTVVLAPRAHWQDSTLIKITRLSQTWPLSITAAIVGVLECVVNVWQRVKQPDLIAQTMNRRRIWINQAKDSILPGQTRVAIVTGGNSGLGYETSKALVEAGFITIIACRSTKRGEEAIKRIEEETGIKGKASTFSLDLSSFDSINAFVRQFKDAGYSHLDVLVNNAGMMDVPFGLTESGFELQFGVNHLGHYLLTLQLLPLLNKAQQGRIVVLSSNALFSSRQIDYNSIQSPKGYSRLGHYSSSKLANILFAKALDRRLKRTNSKITVNACHPGACNTDLFRHDLLLKILMYFSSIFCRSPLLGSMSSVYLSLASGLENTSGEYFFDQIPRSPGPLASDEKAQELLWAKSVEYTGVDFSL